MVETRKHGAKVKPMGRRGEVSRALRPGLELGDRHTKMKLRTGRPKVDPNHCALPLKEELMG